MAHLLEDGQETRQVVRGSRPFPEQVGEGASLDQLHGEEGPAVGQGADLVDGGNAGVLQLPGDLRLLAETALDLGQGAIILPQHLDGQGTIQIR
jgi:hypothetical protein